MLAITQALQAQEGDEFGMAFPSHPSKVCKRLCLGVASIFQDPRFLTDEHHGGVVERLARDGAGLLVTSAEPPDHLWQKKPSPVDLAPLVASGAATEAEAAAAVGAVAATEAEVGAAAATEARAVVAVGAAAVVGAVAATEAEVAAVGAATHRATED